MSCSRRPAALAASLALLGGCGGAAALATDASASTASTSAKTSAVATGHTGSATLTLTGPKGTTSSRTVPITCKVVKGRYVVVAHRARHAKGDKGTKAAKRTRAVSFRLGVKAYKGPGNYTGHAAFIRRSAHVTTLRHYKVPVTLTADGGSFKWTKTLSGKHDPALAGTTVSAAASWTCSL